MKKIYILILLLSINSNNVDAQNNSDLDTTFNTNITPLSQGGRVTSIALQEDGKVLIGGSFNTIDGFSRIGIARLNSNGSLDLSFNPGMGVTALSNGTEYNADVSAISSVQPDGKIIIGGGFTKYNGVSRVGIARLNSDGSLDTTFNTNAINANGISVITFQPDGKIILGGSASIINGTTSQGGASYRSSLIRINSDGSSDTIFNQGAGPISSNTSISGLIRTISVQSDGKIIIGGDFDYFNGTPLKDLARLNVDGTLDTSFNIGGLGAIGAANYYVKSAIQADGKILISGPSLNYNGVQKDVLRLNTNGSIDTSFNLDSDCNLFSSDFISDVQNNGKIIITGKLNSNPNNYKGPIRLNSNGSVDSSYNIVGGGQGAQIYNHISQPDGKVIIVGNFLYFNTLDRIYIARIGVDDLNVSSYESKKIKIYPNPTNSILNLQNNNINLSKIIITDLMGKIILTQNHNTTQLNVEKLACGVYIIEAFSGQERFAIKFVKE